MHKNQHTQRKFWYFAHRKNDELEKIGRFQSQFSRSKINLIFSKMIFLYEYQIRRTTFISSIFYFNHLKKNVINLLNVLKFRAHHYFCLQNIKISFEYADFYAKISLILHTSAKNFITQQTLISTHVLLHISSEGVYNSPDIFL